MIRKSYKCRFVRARNCFVATDPSSGRTATGQTEQAAIIRLWDDLKERPKRRRRSERKRGDFLP